MTDFIAVVPSTWTREQTFAYLADFQSVQEWDPGVITSELREGQAGTQGAVYAVTLSAPGKARTIPYTATEIVGTSRIELRAETRSMIIRDTIMITENGDGVKVRYHARIKLKGLRKVAAPLVGIGLRRAGKNAAEGLTAQLASAF